MKRYRFVLLGIAAIAAGAYAISQDAVKIVWKPKAGSVMKYRVSSTSDFNGQAAEFGMIVTNKVDEIKTDGKIVSTTSMSDMSLKIGGQDMSEMMGGMNMSATVTYTPEGEMVSRQLKGDSPMDNPRMEHAMLFLYPQQGLKVGDTWTRKFPGDKAKGIPANQTVFTFKGVERLADKFDAYKITFEFKETEGSAPMTATGTYWIKTDDGALLKGENEMKNVEMQGTNMNISSKILRISSEGG